MKHAMVLVFLVFSFVVCKAQTWTWAFSQSSPDLNCGSYDAGTHIGIDSLGHIYVYGFVGVFDGGNCGTGIIYKYNPNGTLIWKKTTPFLLGDAEIDKSGNTYICAGNGIGKYDSDGNELWIVYPPGGGFYTLALHPAGGGYAAGNFVSSNVTTRVLCRFSDNGSILWHQFYVGRHPETMTCDSIGNLFIAGDCFQDSASINFGYLAKMDEMGNEMFSKFIPNKSTDIKIDNGGDICIVGWFNAMPIQIEDSIFPAGTKKVFIIKFDPLGNILWYKVYSGILSTVLNLETDCESNIFLATTVKSIFHGSFSFTSTQGESIVIKYAPNGSQLWVRHSNTINAAGSCSPNDLVLNKNGDVYLTGSITGGDFSFGSFALTLPGYSDMLLAKLSEGKQSPCFWQNLVIDSTASNNYTAVHPSGTTPSSTQMVTKTMGLLSSEENEVGIASFEAFPSPTFGLVNISYFNTKIIGELTLTVFNISGKEIFSKTYTSTYNIKDEIDLGEDAAGVYFFEVSDGERKEVRKVVVY